MKPLQLLKHCIANNPDYYAILKDYINQIEDPELALESLKTLLTNLNFTFANPDYGFLATSNGYVFGLQATKNGVNVRINLKFNAYSGYSLNFAKPYDDEKQTQIYKLYPFNLLTHAEVPTESEDLISFDDQTYLIEFITDKTRGIKLLGDAR